MRISSQLVAEKAGPVYVMTNQFYGGRSIVVVDDYGDVVNVDKYYVVLIQHMQQRCEPNPYLD